MTDFTSSLYLGIKHSSNELAGWQQLTSGVPSALFETQQSKELAYQVARLQGHEQGLVAPSTLHLYHDLYNLLSKQPVTVFVDEKVYPVSRYGIEKLFAAKIPVYQFRHLDPLHLNELINTKTKKIQKPVVITDGWCPQCGRPAPINVYSQILKPYGGNTITDDTQATGILGKKTGVEIYGRGGGGILKWLNVNDPNIISITSLAKAFGVPIAAITGNSEFIASFKNNSEILTCSSPASSAHINAGLHALHINNNSGEQRRLNLLKNVSLLKHHLKETNLGICGGMFPVQSLSFRSSKKANALFENLGKRGIKTVLTKGHTEDILTLTFVIRSDHTAENIESLAYHLVAGSSV